MNLPTITITVPILNEEARIGRLLRSIRAQRYPQERVEVMVLDGGSTDRSVEICRRYDSVVLPNVARDQESGKRIGSEAASGEFHMYMDADMEWSHDGCLEALVRPWLREEGLAGSFPSYKVDPADPPLNRYLSAQPLYQDPLMRFLSCSVGETIFAEREGYALCRFVPGKVPVLGIALYRTSFVREVVASCGPTWKWSDVDFAIEIARRGVGPIAFVPDAGIFHRSSMTRQAHLEKLRRNVRVTYLPNTDRRRATYIRWGRPRDVLRLTAWVVYANLVVPGVVNGVLKAIRTRDPAMLYDAWATTVGTDYVLLQFLLDPKGRRLLGRAAAGVRSRRRNGEPRTRDAAMRSDDPPRPRGA